MKYLFALALFALLLGLAYWRARPYIAAARRFLGVLREARRLASDDPAAGAAPRRRARAGEKLARCSACGTWLPASRALTLRNSPDLYCSTACLSGATDAHATRGKSAS